MESSYPTFGLQVAGIISVVIGIGHTAFHRIFRWHRDFQRISALNVKVFTTIHIATTLFLLAAGALTFRYAALLSQSTEVASVVCLSLFVFWCWRLIWQVLYFKPSKIEHDRRLLLLHYVLVLLFAALAVGYGAPLAAASGV
ncbi:hypothetical protein SBP18_12905 [Rhodoferax ferrireducens]|uniref:hypothetical protein n=1 Tax=Rhodoferax ferrireducens TaxID=192843 RepID=UPI00298ECFF3|nr:hypothetical protein [Rhodoferax ferrireducens]WPC65398.1 hypothetical protein SBP18_12905 [Rhodoferax ferrireducens]